MIYYRQAEKEQRKGGSWYAEDQGQEDQEGQIDDSPLRNPLFAFCIVVFGSGVDGVVVRM